MEIYYQNMDKNSNEYLSELHGAEEIICWYLWKMGYKNFKESEDKKEILEFNKMVLDNAEYYLEHHGWEEFEEED